MDECAPKSPIINKIVRLFLQVVFIFVFLTIFFFAYVGNAERKSFKKQMNIVVDNLSVDIDVRQFAYPGQDNISNVILDGTLEIAKMNALRKTKKSDKNIKDQNKKIRNKAFILLGITVGVSIIIAVVLLLTKHCVMFYIHAKEALLVVVAVAMTELLFLNVITRNYWSVDPSETRRQLSKSIQTWIEQPQN